MNTLLKSVTIVDKTSDFHNSKVDILIENGDKITIPMLPQFKKEKESEKHAFVFGMVQRPGFLKFTGKATVSELLAKTQGIIMQRASLKHVKVIRGTPENPVFINVNYYDLLNKGDMKQNVQLMDGDVIFVPRKKLVKLQDTLNQIGSVLSVVMAHPAKFREDYTTGGGLRLETDVSERSLAEENRLGGFSGASAQ